MTSIDMSLQAPAHPSTQAQLDVLDQVIAEVATQRAARPTAPATPPQLEPQPANPTWAAAVPAAINDAVHAAQPTSATTAKETTAATFVVEQPLVVQPLETTQAPAVETGLSQGYAEVELPSPEIPVEVESYLQEIKDHREQLPHEIIVAGNEAQMIQQAQPLRPMIVLPITPEIEKVGAQKSPTWSIRWLVTWSRRLMKMFAGKIVYRAAEAA